MALHVHSRWLSLSLGGLAVLLACSCSVPLGTGYVVEKQQIRVQFSPAPAPLIHVEADYQLKNTGNRPLSSLEIRLPGKRRFHFVAPSAVWDGATAALAESPDDPRNSILSFSQPWTISTRRLLHLTFDLQPRAPGESGFNFAADAFVLPSDGWSPELSPERALFGFGGIPPKQWDLIVEVPESFQVHASGSGAKSSRKAGRLTVRSAQHFGDKYPFVVAGLYVSSRISAGPQEVFLWTRAPADQDRLRAAGDSLTNALQTYNSVFGARQKGPRPLWIVECPVASGCMVNHPAGYGAFLHGDQELPSADMVALDTVLIGASASSANPGASAVTSLAASWLGYGQSPGFYEQQPPLTALPAYAAALGRTAVEGPGERTEIIRRALRAAPKDAPARASRATEDPAALRAKSLLFFYGLEDRYGETAFHKAMNHMLNARRGRGFDLNDLIAALEQETHQDVAEFVRHWMKRPGVPAEFRARYENAPAQPFVSTQEKTP